MNKISQTIGACIVGGCVVFAGNLQAQTIEDQYIGDVYYQGVSYDYGEDVILNNMNYAVEKMEVEINSSYVTVDIYTNYLQNVASWSDGIELGDLFLSNNGWNPVTPTDKDNYVNGEFWEFALVIDDHTGSSSSGIAYLYGLSSIDDYILAEEGDSNVFRWGQETQLDTTSSGVTLVGSGTWSFFEEGITFTIATSLLDLGTDALGLRWTATCANDIIEGAAAVPEPAAMVLFGAGLVSLFGLSSLKRKD